MTEIFFDIATTLLTILAMLLAFQMFFCTLRFSKEWSPEAVSLFKFMILIMFLVILISGITSVYCLNNSIVKDIVVLFYTLNIAIFHILTFIVTVMIFAALVATIFTLKT